MENLTVRRVNTVNGSTLVSNRIGATKTGTTAEDMRLRLVEHIIIQDGRSVADDVRSILAETKIGARRRPALLKRLKVVFSVT